MATPILKGLYLRGNKYWFRYRTLTGQKFISLHTSDLAEAVAKVHQIRTNPYAGSGDTVAAQIETFLSMKRAENRYTETTIRASRLSLNLLAT